MTNLHNVVRKLFYFRCTIMQNDYDVHNCKKKRNALEKIKMDKNDLWYPSSQVTPTFCLECWRNWKECVFAWFVVAQLLAGLFVCFDLADSQHQLPPALGRWLLRPEGRRKMFWACSCTSEGTQGGSLSFPGGKPVASMPTWSNQIPKGRRSMGNWRVELFSF